MNLARPNRVATGRRFLLPLIATLALVAAASTTSVAGDFPEPHDSPAEKNQSPMPAAEAAAKMKVPPGFKTTLFASEPDVRNPIAMAWDARGRMWVAENYTYSDRTQRFDLSLRDRVVIFEDRDGDGRSDARKVFADDVQMLTSVELGRGGVWLLCPPRLLFVPDANGDDVPDGPARVVLDGFDVAQDNYHNFANGLRWGPDGWLYGRCGHSCPGRVGLPGAPDEERVPLDGGIWRFHPEKKVVEALCHGTTNPWGHDWDEHGELFFINTVIGHLWHSIPGAHFKESFGESQNPFVYERMDMIADHYHFDTKGDWTQSRGGKANDLGGGHAHIGMLIHHGRDWPESYRGKLMTINMHGLRANVERLERTATGYVGRHLPDFFVSADPFFRGVEISEGPDGNVYVIDWSDTGECHEHTGVHRSSGRIFKISHGDRRPARPVVKPWCIAGDGRLPQLWLDYQAGETTPDQLRALENDPDEHVRVWAIRLLTDFWPLDLVTGPRKNVAYPDDPATLAMLSRMAKNDSSGLVHRVIASTLQRLPVARRGQLAAELAKHERHAADPDLPLLVWYGVSPLTDVAPEELVKLARDSRWPVLNRSITRAIASRVATNPRSLDELLGAAGETSEEIQTAMLHGLEAAFRGWRRAPRPARWEDFVALAGVQKSPELVRELNGLFGDGRALAEIQGIALNDKAEMKSRQRALETLIDARPDDLRKICESLLDVRVLNATALRGLASFNDPAVAQLLTQKYRRFHADDRPKVIELLVSRPGYASALLESLAVGKSQIPLADVTAAHARQIQSLGDEQLTRRLTEVWGALRPSSQEQRELMAKLMGRLTDDVRGRANLSAGRALFNKTCSACHQLYGEGKKVGPDLTGSQRSNLEYLLSNVLDPSAVVGKDYRMSIVEMVDGRVLNGLIVSKNSQTLVVRTATEEVTLNREDVADVTESTLSAMPDGLLKNLSDDEIRDLLSYLMHPSQVPLPAATEN